jgi:hypothetical protein
MMKLVTMDEWEILEFIIESKIGQNNNNEIYWSRMSDKDAIALDNIYYSVMEWE